jgi:hypothetical protein
MHRQHSPVIRDDDGDAVRQLLLGDRRHDDRPRDHMPVSGEIEWGA